ncbi:hypothetical protein CAPTEDRAFT_210315 [Capitella teleta]|uniref:Vitellogenin domain-containing protein n=1 Tax=Capitella teleta TaxID=283909 RepID=N1PB39_CAPTE|nr:hypothetical protein CAPTEDRAFT_210315 [Capitella teleta]|eukprot:ELU18842.1 hypothetical protein CAPTEDRAFT_210315 [Capitella teleta]
MRWMLAACLIATAVAVPLQETGRCVDKAFQQGWQHTFHYDSHLLTGLPTADDQYTGLKISLETRLQFVKHPDEVDALKVIMKLDNMRIFKVHGALGDQNLPSRALPDHLQAMQLIEPSSPEGQVLLKHLTKTCVFDYKKGQVTSLRVHEGEPEWSINFKKGIVNLFKMNVQPSKSVYTVRHEEDILGKCDSTYTLSSFNSYMHLSKKRHLDSCTERPQMETGFIAGLKTSEGTNSAMDPMVQADYILFRENDHHFAIKEVELKSSYVFTPYLDEKESIVTYIWQKLTCIEANEYSFQENIERLKLVKTSMLQTSNTELSSLDYKSFSIETSYETSEESVRMIDEKLSTIVEKMQTPFTQDTVPIDILRITKMLRFLSTDDILNLVRTYNTHDAFARSKLQLVLDIVPTLSTDAANKAVITMVEENIVTGLPASLMINMMTLTAQPTPELIDMCLQLYKLKMQQGGQGHTKQNRLVKRSLILSVGSLANRMMEQHQRSDDDRQNTLNVLHGFVSEIRSMIQSTRCIGTKIRLVKTIGNFGEPSFLPELKSIIEDDQLPTKVREYAVKALLKLCSKPEIKEQVMAVVMPLFMNTQEETSLRTAAFRIIMWSHPSYHTIEMISHQIENEPNHQIKTLVYSTYLNIANCQVTDPWLLDIILSVNRCLKWIKPVAIMPWDTQYMHTHIYPDMLNMGANFDGILVKSGKSILPESLSTLIRGTVFGKYVQVLEADIKVEGIEHLLKRVVDWFRSEGDKTIASILRMLSNNQETVHGSFISEEIEQLLRQLPVEDMNDAEFKAMGFFKVLGHEMQYITFDKQDLIDLISETTDMHRFLRILVVGQQIKWTRVVSLVDNSVVLPSPIGIPVTLNHTHVQIISVSADLRFEGFESLIRSLVSGGQLSFDALKMKIKTDISIPTYTICSMGSNLAAVQTGFSTTFYFVINIPVDVEMSFDPSTGKLTFKNNFSAQKLDLIKLEVQPFTYFTKIPIESSAYDQVYNKDIDILPVSNPSMDILVNNKYSVPLLMLPTNLDVESKLVIGSPSWSPKFPLMGKQMIRIVLNKQSVRVPSLVTNIDLSEIPQIFACNEELTNYRSGRDSYNVFESYLTTELSTVRPDESFTRKCAAVQIPVTLATAENSNRKIQTQFTYIRSPDWMLHQLNIQTVAQSFYGLPYGLDNIKMLTDVVIDLKKIIKEGFYGDPFVKADFTFGINNFDENKITFKVMKDAPEHIFDDQYRTPRDNIEAYKYTVRVNYDLVPGVKPYLEKCKYFLLPYMRSYLNEINIGSNILSATGMDEINIYGKIIPQWEKVAIVFDLPTGHKYAMKVIMRLPLLTPLTLNHPISLVQPPYFHGVSHLTKMLNFGNTTSMNIGKCELTKTSLATYDGRILELPSVLMKPSCSMLMTRDCSRNSEFAVVMKPTDTTGFKAIRLLVSEYEIEVTPVAKKQWFTWTKTADLEVRVNGERVQLNSFSQEPIVLYTKQGVRQPLCEIKEINDVVEVKCIQLGVTVYSDGSVVSVKTSPWYHGQLCGLCGNSNMEPSDDVRRHESVEVSQQRHFARFVIPSSDCPIQGL